MKKTLFSICLILFSFATYAQLYLGASIGNSFRKQVLTNLQEEYPLNQNSFGWRAHLGYGTGFLTVEAGYRHLGAIANEQSGIPLKSSIFGFDIAARAKGELGPIYGFVRLGAYLYENEYEVQGYKETINTNGPILGAGIGLNMRKYNLGISYDLLGFESNNQLSQLMLECAYTFNND